MPAAARVIERRVRIAAIFVAGGLLVELLALRGAHPAEFLTFALAGVPLVTAGILLFLFSLVSSED